VKKVADILNKADVDTTIVEDLPFVLWRKLLFNVAINAVTTIVRIRNGRLPEMSSAWEAALACFREARA